MIPSVKIFISGTSTSTSTTVTVTVTTNDPKDNTRPFGLDHVYECYRFGLTQKVLELVSFSVMRSYGKSSRGHFGTRVLSSPAGLHTECGH